MVRRYHSDYWWIVFVLIVVFIITAVSNGIKSNRWCRWFSHGYLSTIIGGTLGCIHMYLGIFYVNYLNIMYIPDVGEIVIFMSGICRFLVGFLWYNSYPIQVFMGDTGSLSLGGIIAVVTILIRKELLLPILCGIFLDREFICCIASRVV